MLKEERMNAILDAIGDQDYCSNEDLFEKLKIPLTTLRRDLNFLSEEGKLKRVHGGVKKIKNKQINESGFWEKLKENEQAKQTVANKAVKYLKNNETIFLDAGSACFYLSKLIKKELNLTIYTNSYLNAQELLLNEVENVYMIPGKIKQKTLAVSSLETVKFIEDYYFDVSFIGINAIDDRFNFYTTNVEEAEVKKAIIKNTKSSFGLADKSKLNSKAFVEFSNKKEIDLILEMEKI